MARVGHLGFFSVVHLPQLFRTARHQCQFVLNSVLGGLDEKNLNLAGVGCLHCSTLSLSFGRGDLI